MIHGHGSHGDQLYTRSDIRDAYVADFRRRGFGILTPNLRDNAWMGPLAARDMRDLLDLVRDRFGARRFVFASGSMGGTSNLIYAALQPADVQGVVALCPATDLRLYYSWCRERNEGVIGEIADAIEAAYGGPPDQMTALYQQHSALRNAARLTMPVYVAHGTNDAIIPISQPRLLTGQMAAMPNYACVDMPDGHHDSPLVLMAEGLTWASRQL